MVLNAALIRADATGRQILRKKNKITKLSFFMYCILIRKRFVKFKKKFKNISNNGDKVEATLSLFQSKVKTGCRSVNEDELNRHKANKNTTIGVPQTQTDVIRITVYSRLRRCVMI